MALSTREIESLKPDTRPYKRGDSDGLHLLVMPNGGPWLRLVAARKVESRDARDLAHRIVGVAGQVFRHAVAIGRCERDPSGDLRGALTPHKARNQAAIEPDELPAL